MPRAAHTYRPCGNPAPWSSQGHASPVRTLPSASWDPCLLDTPDFPRLGLWPSLTNPLVSAASSWERNSRPSHRSPGLPPVPGCCDLRPPTVLIREGVEGQGSQPILDPLLTAHLCGAGMNRRIELGSLPSGDQPAPCRLSLSYYLGCSQPLAIRSLPSPAQAHHSGCCPTQLLEGTTEPLISQHLETKGPPAAPASAGSGLRQMCLGSMCCFVFNVMDFLKSMFKLINIFL